MRRRSGGAPLDGAVRDRLEAAYGHRFDTIRIHADAAADAAARALDARAFALGEDIYFRTGAYAPETGDGFRVLAHEVAHTVQQGDTGAGASSGLDDPVPNVLAVGDRDDPWEHAADHAALGAMLGVRVDPTAGVSGTPGGLSGARTGAVVDRGGAGPAVAQRWPWDDGGSSGGGLLDTLASTASSVAGAVGDLVSPGSSMLATITGDAPSTDSGSPNTPGSPPIPGSPPLPEPSLESKAKAALRGLNPFTRIGDTVSGAATTIMNDAQSDQGLGWHTLLAVKNNEVARGNGATALIRDAQAAHGGFAEGMADFISGGARDLAGMVSDVPIVGDLASLGADAVKYGADYGSGASKEIVSMISGVGQAIANPMGTIESGAEMTSKSFAGQMLGQIIDSASGVASGDMSVGDALGSVVGAVPGAVESAGNQVLSMGYGDSLANDRPGEAHGRAATFISSILLGAMGGGGGGARAPRGALPPGPEGPPPTLRTPYAPPGVKPPGGTPPIPEVNPNVVDPHAPTVRVPAPPERIPGPNTQLSPGIEPPGTERPILPSDTVPELPVPRSLPADHPTLPGMPTVRPWDPAPPSVLPDTPRPPSTIPDGPRTIPQTQPFPKPARGIDPAPPPSLPPDTIPGFPAIPRGTPWIEPLAKVVSMNPGTSVVELLMKMGFPINWIY